MTSSGRLTLKLAGTLATAAAAALLNPGAAHAQDAPAGEPAPAPKPADPAGAAPATAPDGASTDVTEDPGKRYYFIGLRYRGTYFPSFILSSFVRDTQSFYFNTIGIEADLRRDGFSFIPAISYTEYSTGDVLFGDKTRDLRLPQNWGLANSSMKGLYLTIDFLWSAPIHKNVQFEYGLGAGVGIMFGDLVVNWVRDDPNGPLTNSEGRRFSQCNTVTEGQGCAVRDHENATTARVGRYSEASWFNGGSKPSVLPYLSIPQIGLRFKPIKQIQARLGLGLSITGIWFGLSANYGLEQPKKE